MQLPRSYISSAVTSIFSALQMVAGYSMRILGAETTPFFLVQPSLCEWKREEGEKREDRKMERERGERPEGESGIRRTRENEGVSLIFF